MMKRMVARINLLLLAFFIFTGLVTAGPAFSVVLFTLEEARQAEWPASLSVGERATVFQERLIVPESTKAGPEIKVLSPEPEKTYLSPLKVLVKFFPREGTQVDLGSLKVECLKFLSINITDRVKKYMDNQGINVEKAELPSGTHKIKITLRDTGGGITSNIFVVKVQ